MINPMTIETVILNGHSLTLEALAAHSETAAVVLHVNSDHPWRVSSCTVFQMAVSGSV